MIIKSLLFIIVCIFVYETYNTLSKMTEEYFTSIHSSNRKIDNFVNLGTKPELNDIAKTIAINCNAYPTNASKIMVYKPESNESLDTPYYAQFKSLEYNPDRKYYWKANKLVEEGIRRSSDDDAEIAAIQALFDNETDPDKQQILQNELDLFNWKKNILATTDSITKLDRDMRDITSDYFPAEIGMNRPWIERHSHIPDYSY